MQCTPPHPQQTPPRELVGTPDIVGIVLGPSLGSVEAARRWARQHTSASQDAVDAVELVVSELVTNALRHSASGTPAGATVVTLTRNPHQYTVEVADDGAPVGRDPSWPQTRTPHTHAEAGRGLALVEKHAAYWDWSASETGRVTVRAVIPR